jgi:hypothetical protein
MLKIAIGCIFYNCYEELKRLVDSIPNGFIDYFIGIDGIYRYNKEQDPNLPDLSNDGSRKVILDHGGGHKYTAVLQHKPNVTEYEKRSQYLDLCQHLNIDVLLIVDSDEFFIYPDGVKPDEAFHIFKRNLELIIKKHQGHNVFGMRTLNIHDKLESYKPRIWYKPGEMRYLSGSHYHYANVITEADTINTFEVNGINYCQHCESVVKGIILAHDHSLRSKEQTQRHDDYIEYLKRFEGLVQSHKYSLEQAHKLAKEGLSYDDILRQGLNNNKVDT